ncbi:hypothetical protein H2198_010530 [Neophaeococcomyces mojaviensis]|uniref:Uncharacterized protein n=1 Tax=Neophaeococcomyces mojaviensis TaxID=3383035 RepID=A0ACC2ZRD1_9EURO|nr:hypothetical protein H2198_010530 [Knufia sp. JES_112]
MRVFLVYLLAVFTSVFALSRFGDSSKHIGPTAMGTASNLAITASPTAHALSIASASADVSILNEKPPAPAPVDNCCTDSNGKTKACVISTYKSSTQLFKGDLSTALLLSSMREDKKKHTTTAPKLTGSPLPTTPPKLARDKISAHELPGPVYPQGCCCLTDDGTPTICAMAECQKSSVSYICQNDIAQKTPATKLSHTTSSLLKAPTTHSTQLFHEDRKKHTTTTPSLTGSPVNTTPPKLVREDDVIPTLASVEQATKMMELFGDPMLPTAYCCLDKNNVPYECARTECSDKSTTYLPGHTYFRRVEHFTTKLVPVTPATIDPQTTALRTFGARQLLPTALCCLNDDGTPYYCAQHQCDVKHTTYIMGHTYNPRSEIAPHTFTTIISSADGASS